MRVADSPLLTFRLRDSRRFPPGLQGPAVWGTYAPRFGIRRKGPAEPAVKTDDDAQNADASRGKYRKLSWWAPAWKLALGAALAAGTTAVALTGVGLLAAVPLGLLALWFIGHGLYQAVRKCSVGKPAESLEANGALESRPPQGIGPETAEGAGDKNQAVIETATALIHRLQDLNDHLQENLISIALNARGNQPIHMATALLSPELLVVKLVEHQKQHRDEPLPPSVPVYASELIKSLMVPLDLPESESPEEEEAPSNQAYQQLSGILGEQVLDGLNGRLNALATAATLLAEEPSAFPSQTPATLEAVVNFCLPYTQIEPGLHSPMAAIIQAHSEQRPLPEASVRALEEGLLIAAYQNMQAHNLQVN